MTAPVLRAINEAGDSYDDPSEDLLYDLLAELDADNRYVIVEQLDAPNDQYYVQALRTEDGPWVVEYRQGDLHSHRTAESTDMRTVHRILTGWAFRLPSWSDGVQWRPLA